MNRPLVYVPIEPLAERYSVEWYYGLRDAFAEAGYAVATLDGEALEDTIKVGTFLDINSTTHYKWTQLQQISKMFHQGLVADGTVFWFSDLEFWGLESVRLMAQMNKVNIKIAGFYHAASHTIEDAFSIAAPYQKYTEVGWLAACDLVCVGSHYHKQAIIERRLTPLHAEHLGHRIVVTQNPIFTEHLTEINQEKKRQIILCNRFDKEKRPNESLRSIAEILTKYPEWSAVVTTGRATLSGTDVDAVDYAHALALVYGDRFQIRAGLTKAQYHAAMAESMLMFSHSIEESYGICIAEALYYGTVPVLSAGLSHVEFPYRELFTSQENLMRAIHPYLAGGNIPVIERPPFPGTDNIIKELGRL